MSIYNLHFNLGLNLSILIAINIISLIIVFFVYFRLKNRNFLNKGVNRILVFIIAGNICSLIDKLTLGGSLDYILFGGYIHDLKDIYLYLAIIFICKEMALNYNFKSSTKDDIEFIKKMLF